MKKEQIVREFSLKKKCILLPIKHAFLFILLIEMQKAHVGSVPLELPLMVGMYQLHLTSTEMVLAVGLAIR